MNRKQFGLELRFEELKRGSKAGANRQFVPRSRISKRKTAFSIVSTHAWTHEREIWYTFQSSKKFWAPIRSTAFWGHRHHNVKAKGRYIWCDKFYLRYSSKKSRYMLTLLDIGLLIARCLSFCTKFLSFFLFFPTFLQKMENP